MTDQLEQRGLRLKLAIAGQFMMYDSVPLSWTHNRKMLVTPVSDGGARQDILLGSASLPNLLRTHEFSCTFNDLPDGGDIDFLHSICGLGQPVDVGIFKQEHDFFDGDGATTSFLLPRRVAYPAITPPANATLFDWYNLSVISWSGPRGLASSTPTPLTVTVKTSSTIGSGSPSSGEAWFESDGHMDSGRWRTLVRTGDAPAASHDNLEVVYLPLDRCAIDKESDRQFQAQRSENDGVHFMEIW